ncbi:GNAT family N-acetyltransferase [Herbiconiux sp. CPCC 203407]|uniref:GNAT family N-acetyltransferase n=1 Tax=Herbiconiux oxytropis TaxID=2970915 RepID=A0AA41XE26_9MICO|nr:GNAT family N-acetyltransferase [Herbiconiux oxytropis]MCS5721468.1 GNAT family N-acetyltransferase [Herbiconiux oxytropis]MCS5724545.1 GNAT family N-acetyltransferase [Herbiconiux oxytropis]
MFRVRDFHPEDIDAVLRLWEETRTDSDPVYGLSEVISSCQEDHAVVAVQDDRVIGAAVGRAAHAQGWIVFVATQVEWQDRGVGKRMLAALEKRMAGLGLQKLSVLLPESAVRTDAFSDQGFVAKKNLRYFERQLPVQRKELDTLSELGGRILPRDLWEGIGGMQAEKELLERRLVAPLANADLAAQFGVVPPSAVVLFGPPGTGKTTFARAIASRLEWSFVEVFPSRLAADPAGLAGALRETFVKIDDLEHAVVFIDEVEEIAVQRGGEPPSALQGVTNELLKIIPAFRDKPNRLLVCATNFIRALDTAFLRHGRFDYVIPIGLPDAQARASIWSRYLPEASRDVDVASLVEHSDGFSPADIEFAARKASQTALETALFADVPVPSTAGPELEHYLTAISGTRATVSRDDAEFFLDDIRSLARV